MFDVAAIVAAILGVFQNLFGTVLNPLIQLISSFFQA